MAPNVTAHFFAANDLNGDPLLEITDEDEFFRGLKLRPERDGLGGGEILLARRVGFALFDSGAVQPEVFVRFLIHAYSDTVYYPWGFFLTKREQVVVTVQEDGDEVFRFGGAGPKMYLDRAILGTGGPASGWSLDLANGVWRWTEAATVGRILDRIIAQDANEDDPALPDLTDTFDADDDSSSVAWADTDISGADDQYQIPIGTSLLQALWDLDDVVELTSWIDLGSVATPKFELNVSQGLGADKTGSAFGAGVCLLKEGANIVNESLVLEGASIRKASHVVVEGASGAWGEAVRSSFSPGDYVKRVKIEYTRSKNPNILEKAGLRWLRKQDNGEKEITVDILPGASDSAGFYFPAPNRNLWLSNLISVDTSADGTTHTPIDITPAEDQLVTGLEIDLLEAGDTETATSTARSWGVKVLLNKERPSQVPKAPDQKSAASGHTGCCPPPFPAECDPVPDPGDTVVTDTDSSGWLGTIGTGDGFTGNYRFIGGSGGTSMPTETVSGLSAGDYRLTVWLGGSEHKYTGTIQLRDSGGAPPADINITFPNAVRAPGGHGDVTPYSYDFELPSGYDRIRYFHGPKMGGWRYQAQILALSEPPPAGEVDCIPTGTSGDPTDPLFDNVPHYNDPRFTNTDQHPTTFLSKPDAINNSGGDLEIGDAVVPDLTLEGAVTTTTDAAQSELPVRIVTSAGADGEQISIATAGYVTQVTMDGTADAGDWLGISSTAGALESLGTTRTEGAVALVLADDGAGVPVLVWLLDMPDPAGAAIDYGEDADISTLDFDDTPDAGVLDEVARADHVHGMPSDPGGGSGGATVDGFLPYAFVCNFNPQGNFSSSDNAPANGGSYAAPFFLTAPLKLHGLSVRNVNTSLARSWEFRVYQDLNSSGTLNEVANANGSESFTATAASIRTATCSTPPTLNPGAYWVVVRNTHASNNFSMAFALQGANPVLGNASQTKTLSSALGSTLDFTTSWTKSVNVPAMAMLGRVFGQSTNF